MEISELWGVDGTQNPKTPFGYIRSAKELDNFNYLFVELFYPANVPTVIPVAESNYTMFLEGTFSVLESVLEVAFINATIAPAEHSVTVL